MNGAVFDAEEARGVRHGRAHLSAGASQPGQLPAPEPGGSACCCWNS